jgi:hypothetical protein
MTRTVILIIFFLRVQPLLAQSEVIAPHVGDRSIGAWIGYSPISRVEDLDTQKRQLLLIGARAEWVIETAGPLALAATGEVVPVAVVTHTPTYTIHNVTTPNGSALQLKEQTGYKPVFGGGASPFGFKVYLASSPKIRFFGATSVGALWFTRDMPVPDARKFNFSFEYGGGLELLRSFGSAMIVGYKFHHLSNANSAAVNPGLNSNVFYFGLSRAR